VAIASSAYPVGAAGAGPPAIGASAGGLAPGTGEKLVSAASTVGKPLARAELGVTAVMTGLAFLAYLLSAWLIADDSDSAFRPADGVTVFAIFYVLAQAIERLLSPIAKLIPTTAPEGAPAEATVAGGLTTRSRALKQRAAAVAACAETQTVAGADITQETARDQAKAAANWHEVLQQTYANASTVWALGAAAAFVLCAWLDVYLLNAIGVTSWDPPTWIDLLITGLAVGGGTKPLHDLIDRIQKKDDRQAESSSTSPTPGGGRAGVVVPEAGTT
jgi:hypothetical protein